MRIAVASGKGGTGKTTVAVNLALTAVRAGQAVHLCDCDVEEPNAHIFLNPDIKEAGPVKVPFPVVDQEKCDHCGKCAEICEFNAIASLPESTIVFGDLCHSCSGCWLVCPTGAIEKGERILGEVGSGTAHSMLFSQGLMRVGETVVPPMIQVVKEKSAGSPWAILDSPPGTTCPVVETLRDVDYVVLVTEPTPFGMHDLDLAVKLARALDLPFGVVINRDVDGHDMIDHYCADEGIEILVRIPFRRGVAEACAEGALAIDVDAEVAASMTDLFQALRAREVKA